MLPSFSFRRHPRTSADVRDVCGRMMEAGGVTRKRLKMAQMAETRAGRPNYCFRQLPETSADILGRPRCVWAANGTWGIIRKRAEKCPKWQKLGRNGEIIAPVSLRLLPSTSVDIRDVWAEDGRCGIIRTKAENSPKWQNLGRDGKL